VRLEASTKPHGHNLIHEFLINMAFTMACPNFKKGLKIVPGPLRVKDIAPPRLSTPSVPNYLGVLIGTQILRNL
jgi:hypothetical protein